MSGPVALFDRVPRQRSVSCLGHRQLRHSSRGGALVVLLMAEVCSGRRLKDIIGPPSSLSDEGLEDLLEGYDDVASHVVLRLSTHNNVRVAR